MHGLTFHGGRLEDAAARFPDAQAWIDLSTGINPFAWPVDRIEPIDQRRLPSVTALGRLHDAAAAMFESTALALTAVPGSEIGLRLLAHLGLPKPWRVVVPTYRTHRDALPGAEPIAIDALDEAASRGGTVLLANPSNPEGRLIAPNRLLGVARMLRSAGGLLVIDEAFADAVPNASVLPLLSPDDRVLVLRSFGKFFGLAGVRLGFVCGDAGIVAAVAHMLGSWPVSASAIAIGTAAYRDTDWIAAIRQRLDAARATLDDVLGRRGLLPRGACPLFRLVETRDAAVLFDRLGRGGILTRPFDDAPHRLRIGLPDGADALARLDEALRHR